MAILTNLASTLTARYFPSNTLTDAFYLDGRLFGKREARQADITLEKNERGYFLSVFAHPKLSNYDPGMMPPYEPLLRGTCNEVKFGRKEIDEMIEGFLSTAVDVTGKARIADTDDRSPYFSGVIIRDSEAFAVTIGTGLAFLYRDDTLYPLTDAGIPMEPIDAKGNRVADFLYYCSSKTANAQWSNFFTLSQDDCLILCNKEIYDALGQRELLRILDEADDQCDAAGVVITQASARMPDVPMQFAISFVEDVVSDEKKGLFGFRKKVKEEGGSDMSIQSTMEGGLVGAAANAAAASGFAGSMTIDDYQPSNGAGVVFGDRGESVVPPAVNQQASADKGFVVEGAQPSSGTPFVQFLDTSVGSDVSEVSAEDVMKTLFADSVKATSGAAESAASAGAAAVASTAAIQTSGTTFVSQAAESATESVFVNDAVNPFAAVTAPSPSEASELVSRTDFVMAAESEADKTKPVEKLDAAFLARLEQESRDREAAVRSAVQEEPEVVIEAAVNPFVVSSAAQPQGPSDSGDVPEVPGIPDIPVTDTSEAAVSVMNEQQDVPFVQPVVSDAKQTDPGVFVFAEDSSKPQTVDLSARDSSVEFDPYGVGTDDEMQNAAPPVFGADGTMTAPTNEEIEAASEGIPVPEFDIESIKNEPAAENSLGIEFPGSAGPSAETKQDAGDEPGPDDISLPFENGTETVIDNPAPSVPEEIPEMPLYGANIYETPVAASNSDEPVAAQDPGVVSYGQMVENESMSPVEEIPELPIDFAQTPVKGDPKNQNIGQAYAGSGDVSVDQNYASAENMNSGYESYAPASFGTYDEQPYAEGQYGYAPGQYQEGYDENASSGSSSEDYSDDWINSILGISDSAFDDPVENPNTAPGAEAAGAVQAGGAAMSDNGGYGYRNSPVQGNPGANSARSAQIPRASSSGNGSGSGKRRVPRLNRNGYMFLAFVIICIVCLIILISAIVRSCGKKDDAEVIESDIESVVSEKTEITEETTAATTSQDPSYPIGRFQFSENIGFRTWWDLFNTVYGINDIANTSDPRIQIIVNYNGLDASYTPSSGDVLLLPPVGVLDGTIPVTFSVGSTGNAGSDNTVSGEVQTVDGTQADEGETVAEGEAEPAA